MNGRAVGARLAAALTPWRDRMGRVRTYGQGRWRALSDRERVQVVAMLVLVVGAAVWLLVAKPALASIRHWQEELPKLRSQAATLQEVLAEAGVVRVSLDTSPRDRTRQVVESLAAAGLAGRYRLAAPRTDAGATARAARAADGADADATSNAVERPIEIEFLPTADTTQALSWLMQAPPGLRLAVERLTIERGAAAVPAGASSASAPAPAPGPARITATLVAQRA